MAIRLLLCGMLLACLSLPGIAQPSLTNSPQALDYAMRAVRHIYNCDTARASPYIDSLGMVLPGHPAKPMLQALSMYWASMPLTPAQPVFEKVQSKLFEVIEVSDSLRDVHKDHPEGIYFTLVCRALLAANFADDGNFMKAANHARKMYSLMTKGLDMTEQFNEFYFTSGLYNYYRERYPELVPLLKTFIWFFKSGNKTLGLEQMHKATEVTVLSEAEAHLYMTYMLIRFEYKPAEAEVYAGKLSGKYPNNPYYRTMWVETMALSGQYSQLQAQAQLLAQHPQPYYQAAAQIFSALHDQHIGNKQVAMAGYHKGLTILEDAKGYTGRLPHFAQLGLGKLYQQAGNYGKAREYYNDVKKEAWYPQHRDEAVRLLKELPD